MRKSFFHVVPNLLSGSFQWYDKEQKKGTDEFDSFYLIIISVM